MTLPPYLYKYEPFSAQSLQNLKNQVIHFGSPLNFNDPYDCAVSPRIKNMTDAEVERVRQYYLENPKLEEKKRIQIKMATLTALREMLLHIGQNLLSEKIQEFLRYRGVSCFSEKKDSLLMWSHYSDHCKGFCLEFSTSNELFQKIRKVCYTKEMPEVDIVSMFCDQDFDAVINDLYCTKAIEWAYEHEWRGIHNKVGVEYTYSSSALTGIYFGPDMPHAALEIIALILAGQNEHVQLWQGSRSKSNFSVEFRPVTYTPHLEAKRKGLLENEDV